MALFVVDLQYIFIFVLLWLFSAFFFYPFFFFVFKKRENSNVRLPPSPPALPIIGHLHLLLSIPWFKTLQKLSSKYGPILHLRVFGFSVVVVSSASLAYEFYRTQDANLSSRNHDAIENSIIFGSYGFLTAPYGDYSKFMKKLLVTSLLGQQHLERSRILRIEEMERFYVDMLEKARRREVVDVRKEMMKLTSNIMFRMLMGRRCSEENGEADEIKDLILKSGGLLNKIILANALRALKKFGMNSWFEKEIRNISHRYDVLLEKFLKEHEENPNKEHEDMMDLLLEIYHDENAEYKITRNQMKAFLVDLFLGGTDSSTIAIQWIMAELINHPNILRKVRAEIDSVVEKTRLLRETDLPNLPYLRAVVKEGLRLHPPGALIPRKCQEQCKLGGFDIPKNTTLLVNSYAIMRDVDSWEDSDKFRPERFLVASSRGRENDIEQALNYVPFGGGRRGCPGANLAYLFMGTAIGTMVYYFDWRIDGHKVKMEETGDMGLFMVHPLKCTPILRINTFASTS